MQELLIYLEFFIVAISAIFVIINPLTVTFLFLSVLPYETENKKKELAWRAFKIATVILYVFAILGSMIFQFLGITLGAFQIAGGIILFIMSFRMITQSKTPSETYSVADEAAPSSDNLAIIPLSIPFLSGPGSITTVMILSSKALTFYHMIVLFLAIIITTLSCYYTMKHSKYLVKLIGETGKEVIVRIFGLLLAVIAVQFIIDGVGEAIYRDFGWLFEIIENNNYGGN